MNKNRGQTDIAYARTICAIIIICCFGLWANDADAGKEYIVTDWKIKETILTLCIATAQQSIPDIEGVEFNPAQAKFSEDCIDWAKENLDLRLYEHSHALIGESHGLRDNHRPARPKHRNGRPNSPRRG